MPSTLPRLRSMSRTRPIIALLAAERGDSLIEVLVSALLVALIVSGVFMGFDVTSRSAAQDRAKEHAIALAQLDEDRMRGMQVSDLENLAPSTRYATIDNTQYKIVSSVSFWSDSGAASACSLNGTGSADYLTTNSVVTWTGMPSGMKPIRAESIVTPPVGGAIQVLVTDGNGVVQSNVSLTLSGTGAANGTTDANGCATFGGLALGPYTVSANAQGFVDVNGNSPATATTSAIANVTNHVTLQLGLPGTISVPAFTTTHPDRTDTANVTSGSSTISDTSIVSADLWKPVTGPGIPSPAYVGTVTQGSSFQLSSTSGSMTTLKATATTSGELIAIGSSSYSAQTDQIYIYRNCAACVGHGYGTNGSMVSSFNTGATVFPANGYAVYAGSCTADAPTANGQASNPTVNVTSGQTVSTGTLQLPNVVIYPYQQTWVWDFWPFTGHWQTSPMTSKPHVIITDNNCGNSKETRSTVNNPSTSGSGALSDPQVPYGSFTVCVDDGSNHGTATLTSNTPNSQRLDITLNSSQVCT